MVFVNVMPFLSTSTSSVKLLPSGLVVTVVVTRVPSLLVVVVIVVTGSGMSITDTVTALLPLKLPTPLSVATTVML